MAAEGLEPKSTPSKDGDPLAEYAVQRQQSLESEVATWRTEWQCISDYIMPRKSQIDQRSTPGVDDYTQDIYDTEGPYSARVLAAGTLDQTMSGIWFENQSPDKDAPEDARQWYRETGEIMLDLMLESNIYLAAHECIYSRGVFGNAHMHIEEDDEKAFFAISEDVGEFTIDVNHRGEVDTVYVTKDWTAKQWVDEFGIDEVAEPIRESFNVDGGKGLNKMFKYLYAIEPRPNADREPGRLDGKNKPIRALHVDIEHRKLMREGGFDEMPSMVTRFLLWNRFVKYGFGPGFESLPEVKGVNFKEKTMDALADRKVNPPLQIPDNQKGNIDIRAAGRTLFNHKDPDSRATAWLDTGEYNIGKDRAELCRARIRRAFFVEFFQLLTNSDEVRREKTAFEVGKMLAEQVRNFSPTFSYLKEDFLDPLLTRIFSICLRKGLFPPVPDSVLKDGAQGKSIPVPKVNHISKIAMLIKAAQNSNWIEFLQLVGLLAEMSPASIAAFERKFNMDRAIVTMADNLGVPSEFRNTPEEEDLVAEQQQQAAAAAAATEAATAGSAIAKNVSQIDPDLAKAMPAIF